MHFDCLVPEACRISESSGVLVGESVARIGDEYLYVVVSIEGDAINIERPTESGGKARHVVPLREVFAMGVMESLALGVSSDEIIEERKKFSKERSITNGK